jgi:hypothetical protein
MLESPGTKLRAFSMFTPLGSEDSASLRASLAAYADLLGKRLDIGDALTGCRARGEQRGSRRIPR